MGSESGVRALALTPPGVFGDLPVCGKASNRGSRPYFGSGRSAQPVNISQLWKRHITYNLITIIKHKF